MKNPGKSILILVCLIAMVQPSWAKEKYIVAVLPFSVISAENIEYVRQGIGNMLASRISVSDRIEVINRDILLNAFKETAGKELALADVYGLGKSLNADYVVWGSITKIGNSISIDGRLVDIAAYKTAVVISAQSQGMDEIIPKMNEFSQKIEAHILGLPTPTAAVVPPPRAISGPSQPPPQGAREAEIISGMRGATSGAKGTFTAAINPEFINAAQPVDSKTFWKSLQFASEFRGLDIGDVNGDGLNETVMIDPHTVFIYQKKGNEFRAIQQIVGSSHDNYLAVDVADINNNGIKEIIVTNMINDILYSFVIEFRNGKFVTIASDLRWFLRVIDNSSGQPILLGQKRGLKDPFDNPIYEIIWQGGEYREGRKMLIPQGLSVFGLTIERIGGGAEKIIALANDDYLYIFQQTDRPLSKVLTFGRSEEMVWKSRETFGGSNSYVESYAQTGNLHSGKGEADVRAYLNPRIATYDTNKDGKREIILIRNLSATGRSLERMRAFNAAEVYSLEWDGVGIVENWHTKRIDGYVADFQFRDIDNDGENEIVLALVLPAGGSSRSVVVSYSLKGQ